MDQIRLSPSTLNLYLECPRCFWLQFNKRIKRPAGIFPSLPGGMDNVIKKYFDKYRIENKLPPELVGTIKSKLLPDMDLIKNWRDWRKGLTFTDSQTGAILVGALDDCLQDDEFHIPLDYKTRGYAPKEGDSEKYYSGQLSFYALLLDENGYKVRDHGYLVYYYPKSVSEKGMVEFAVELVKITTDKEKAKKNFRDAVRLLQKEIPPKSAECEYCNYRDTD